MHGSIIKAVLVAFDAPTFTATVRPYGSPTGPTIASVPVSRLFNATGGVAELVAGRTVIVAEFSPANPTDACIVAVYTP